MQSKSMDWFLYDMDLHHERVKTKSLTVLRDRLQIRKIEEKKFFRDVIYQE